MNIRHAIFALLVTVVSVAAIPAADATSRPSEDGRTAQPDAPSDLENRNAHGQAFLVWSPVDNAAGYNIYRDDQYIDTVYSTHAFDVPPAGYAEYYVTAFAGPPSDRAFSTRSNTVRHVVARPSCVVCL